VENDIVLMSQNGGLRNWWALRWSGIACGAPALGLINLYRTDL